ncbi:MAG: glycosyltransferase [Nitrospiraceae bacterium]
MKVDPTSVSVIICSKDRHQDLERAVASVRAADHLGAQVEIVVVEEGDVPRALAGTRYVFLPRQNRGFGYARNMGVREATGALLVFLDDDCEAEKGWLESLLLPFHDERHPVGVAGAVSVRGCGPLGYAENILGFPAGGLRYRHEARGLIQPTRYLSTCNCAYRREALVRYGGFPENARNGHEDALLAERVSASGLCVYTPHAVVYHRARDRWGAIFHWFIRRGASELATFGNRLHPVTFGGYILRSSWSVRLLVLLAVIVMMPSGVRWLPLALGMYYMTTLWRFRFARQYPSHRIGWWVVPLVKVTMDAGNEIGRLRFLMVRAGL